MQFIVNVTSYHERLHTTALLAIRSLLNQTEQADRLILWLAHGTNVPQSVADLTNKGLEIRYCEDYRSYKKLIPALEQFPNDVLITVDDDFYYPMDLLANLKVSYFSHPERIHINRAHEIVIDKYGELQSYKDWNFCVSNFKKEALNFSNR